MATISSLKDAGNELFKQGRFLEALVEYSNAVALLSSITDELEVTQLRATLFSNKAACYMKLGNLEQCIDDSTQALEANPSLTKALYRRGNAYYLVGNNKHAVLDLKRLLQIDATNREALDLMRQVRTKVEIEAAGKSEIQNCLKSLPKSLAEGNAKMVHEVLRALVSLCVDDKSHAAELLRNNGLFLLDQAFARWDEGEIPALVLTAITSIANHNLLGTLHLALPPQPKYSTSRVVELTDDEEDEEMGNDTRSLLCKSGKLRLAALCSVVGKRDNQTSHSAICLLMRILKSLPLMREGKKEENAAKSSGAEGNEGKEEEEEEEEEEEGEPLLETAAVECITMAFSSGLQAASNSHSTELFTLVSDAISSFVGDCADYLTANKEVDHRLENVSERKARMKGLRCLRKRSKMHAQISMECGLLDEVVSSLNTPSGSAVTRARAISTFGRIVKARADVETIKAHFSSQSYFQGENLTPTSRMPSMDECLLRAAVTAALFIPTPELGLWALGQPGGSQQLLMLMSTLDTRCQDMAAEVMCLAAANDGAGSLLEPLVSSPAFKALLMSPNSSTRAAAASTLTKLSIMAKAMDESSQEVAQVLNTAFDVLKVAVAESDSGTISEGSHDSKLVSFSVFDLQPKGSDKDAKVKNGIELTCTSPPATVERAVEIIASMIGRTHVKEEVVHGSYRIAPSVGTLISVSPTLDERSTAAYGIAHILAAITVTNTELRAKALAEKDMTVEQYDKLQELQRIKTKDEKTGEVLEEKKADKETDTPELCHMRIKRMVTGYDLVPLLCRLLSKGSAQTVEAAARTMRQICVEETVRGQVVQQGGLKACCQLATDDTKNKDARREAAHAVAKTLVSTNPNLLSEHQRLGSVTPLLQLCRDVDATNLQQFESLLALTNILSCGASEQERFCAEKGVAAVHSLIFSENRMVRRAACEVFCNVPLHENVLKILRQPSQVRLWLGLSEDWDGDDEGGQNVLIALATSGTLAVAVEDEQVCTALMEESCAKTILKLFESENPDLVHRALVMVGGLASSGGKGAAKYLIANNIVPALVVVAKIMDPRLAQIAKDTAKVVSDAMR